MKAQHSQPKILEACDRLEVMRNQEESTYSRSDYLKETKKKSSPDEMIDQSCRRKILNWYFQVVGHYHFHRSTVSMAMAYLDQYLSSGKATHAIKSRKEYRLAAMTALYLAIKLFEQIEMNASVFATMTRNAYSPEEFARMENEMLFALNWRLNGPPALNFIEHFFALFPNVKSRNDEAWETLLNYSRHYAELTLGDYYYAVLKPSTVAICCISTALKQIPTLLRQSGRNIFLKISLISNIDLSSCQIKAGEKRLMRLLQESSPQAESNCLSRRSRPNREKMPSSGDLSPICVSQVEANNDEQIR